MKRHWILPALVLGTSCATQPTDPNQPVSAACDQSVSCFYEQSIRSFQVLDDRTIIVIVGRDRCPYKLELDGFFCDVSMSPFLSFNDPDGRICTYDRSFVAGGPFARDGEYCRVRQVTPMTDDELLEAYATKGLTQPLPAKGSGEIEVEEAEVEDGTDEPVSPPAPSTDAPPAADAEQSPPA